MSKWLSIYDSLRTSPNHNVAAIEKTVESMLVERKIATPRVKHVIECMNELSELINTRIRNIESGKEQKYVV